jgi:hypothetical protein
MRRRFLILAGVLFLVALVTIVVFFSSVVTSTVTVASPLTTQATGVETVFGSFTATVVWTGGNLSTLGIEVFSCGQAGSCAGANQTPPVASGNGASGSLTFTLEKGYRYLIQTNGTATVVVTVGALASLFGLGLVLFVVALILLILGLILKPRGPSERAGGDPSSPTGSP